MRNPAFNWETSSSFESLTFLWMCWQIMDSFYHTIMETLRLEKIFKINTSLQNLLDQCWGCNHELRDWQNYSCASWILSPPLVQYNIILSILFFPVTYPTTFNFHYLDVDSWQYVFLWQVGNSFLPHSKAKYTGMFEAEKKQYIMIKAHSVFSATWTVAAPKF